MLRIDRLRLQLPPSMRDDAGEIARLVGEELREMPVSGSMRIDRLALPPLEATPATDPREVARAIAASITAQLGGARRTG